MKGRRVSDETIVLVRQLRRRGLSLRGIARRARISKTSVHRLTKGTERIATGDRTGQAVRQFAAPGTQVQGAKIDDEGKSELDQLRAYRAQFDQNRLRNTKLCV
jgi:AcrR family transcriptional regulator